MLSYYHFLEVFILIDVNFYPVVTDFDRLTNLYDYILIDTLLIIF